MTDIDVEIDAGALIAAMARRARAAARTLAAASSSEKARGREAMAAALRDGEAASLNANATDMASAVAMGLSPAMLDRLKLTPESVAAMADGVASIAALRAPVGEIIDTAERPNGLVLTRVRVPIGVIGIIYERRPNVTADAAALAFMSGNAAILRGGSEAIRSNRAIHAAFVGGLGSFADAIQLVPVADRAAVGAMLAAEGTIDVSMVDPIEMRQHGHS